MWKQLLQRSARENMSLQGQIREMLVAAILDGQLPAGVPIPSSREMAEQLGVARNTVVLAYQQLADEGYLVSRQRSGHFVNTDMATSRLGTPARPSQDATACAAVDWSSRFQQRPSQQRSIVKPADWQKHPYPFLYGQFDAALFPTADWRECCIKSLSVLDIRDWAPDQIARDDDSLVQQIRTRVLPRRGVWASADEIVVTVGAQHALYMIADLLMREGTRVGIEEPGYPDARNIFARRTSQLVPLPVDEEGLPVTDALRDLDVVYATPNHQCPTTATMGLKRREALLKMADESDFIVIEDDYESENRFDGDPIPALKSLDRSNRVIYVGSLSKTLAPGLRIGYVVGPAELVAELRALRRLMLRHPPAYTQRAFALFLSLGHHDALLRRLASAQRERATALRSALAQHLPQCSVAPAAGGSSCWVSLPEQLDATALAEQARDRGVLIEPGEVFFMTEPPPRQHFRMGYSSIAPAAIEPGVKVLAELVRGFERRR
ncbi:aminotransferase class I/II-fold pyridoxal phosphate-dependent enzyme [Variovorax paradoxus]|uniref:Aminotransferase class I/II-fold pyridoxal phosphate-dependent enzyme n=1 Tax=Variovorax paradoxus TaxID=34073 RepID=A0A5Q0M9Y0_VARPD|nr:PLP-dependent aminotransferase family protein [Variovorax paradoxus]QFZ86213.1 aminotransferase class I/II-fold pyridoxal phosphate-dependent enzyme [Variovorax paradoxus]